MKKQTNSTLARKPSNTMNKNEGTSHEARRADQSGDNASFAFNGQMGDGVNRAGDRGLCANPMAHMVKNPDAINHGMMKFARTGNTSDSSVDRMERIGPSATRDPLKQTKIGRAHV